MAAHEAGRTALRLESLTARAALHLHARAFAAYKAFSSSGLALRRYRMSTFSTCSPCWNVWQPWKLQPDFS